MRTSLIFLAIAAAGLLGGWFGVFILSIIMLAIEHWKGNTL